MSAADRTDRTVVGQAGARLAPERPRVVWLTPGRAVAIEQIAGLRLAYERRETLQCAWPCRWLSARATSARSSGARTGSSSAPRISARRYGFCDGSSGQG